MNTIYERTTGTSTTAAEAGTIERTYKDVCVVGRMVVDENTGSNIINPGVSRNGNKYYRVPLVTAYDDPDFGIVSDCQEVLFIDRPKSAANKYESLAASNNAKKIEKSGAGSYVMVRGTCTEQVDPENGEQYSFFGQSFLYPGSSCTFKARIQSDESVIPGMTIIFGYASVTEKDGKKSLSVSLNDAGSKWNPYWVAFEKAGTETIPAEDFEALKKIQGEDGKEHARLVAFKIKPSNFKKVTTGEGDNAATTSATAAYESFEILV